MKSLANLKRPATFGSAIGEAAKKNGSILKNQIMKGTVAHAYLFDGLRGSGKTTTARTLAKALNCLDLKNGEPCGCCENCRRIEEGSSPDVKEVDCARNNGVDFAKSLEEDATFRPIDMKKKVFILDECHCLTNDAFSSLLKIVETPPEWCVFIFATTDPQKMPVTIRSRCQEFPFKAVSKAEMSEHLINIAKDYGVELEPGAADAIARHSEGSVRDAVMALETCMGEESRSLTEEKVNEILGTESWQQIFMVLDALKDGNRRFITMCVDRWFNEGRKITDVITDCLTVVIDRLRFLSGVEPTGTEDFVNYVRDCTLTESKAFVIADGLRETYEKMKYSPDRGILTVSLLKISAKREDASLVSENAILERLTEAERTIALLTERLSRIESGAAIINPAQTAQPVAETVVQAQPIVSDIQLPELNDFFGDMFSDITGSIPVIEEPVEETVEEEIGEEAVAEETETDVEEETTESVPMNVELPPEFVGETKSGYSVNPLDDIAEDEDFDDQLLESTGIYEYVPADDGFVPCDGEDIPFENTAEEIPESIPEEVSDVGYEAYEPTQEPVYEEQQQTTVNTDESVPMDTEGFSNFDDLFAAAVEGADDDMKRQWEFNKKLKEDEKLFKAVSFCTREEKDGKILLKINGEKNHASDVVEKFLNVTLHKYGFDDFIEVIGPSEVVA